MPIDPSLRSLRPPFAPGVVSRSRETSAEINSSPPFLFQKKDKGSFEIIRDYLGSLVGDNKPIISSSSYGKPECLTLTLQESPMNFLIVNEFILPNQNVYEWWKCDFDVFERPSRREAEKIFPSFCPSCLSTFLLYLKNKMSVSIKSLWLSQIHDRECTNNARQSKNKQQDGKSWRRTCSRKIEEFENWVDLWNLKGERGRDARDGENESRRERLGQIRWVNDRDLSWFEVWVDEP